MSVWNTFDDAFWLTLAGIIVGLLGVLIRFCFLSKCDNVSICFGILKIHRAVELEIPNVEDDVEIQNEEKSNVPTNS
jgi:hypothetical protein